MHRSELIEKYAVPDRERTHLRMNFISSADGAATLGERSGGLGGELDQRLMRVLRMMSDAVLVGAGTVRAEGYGGLGLSHAEIDWRRRRGLADHPRLVVVTDELDLSPEQSVFTGSDRRPLVVTNHLAPKARADALTPVADVVRLGDQHVDLTALVQHLDQLGDQQLLGEGGPHLFGALLEAGLVDELCMTLAPKLVAGAAMRIAVGSHELNIPLRLQHALPTEDGFVLLRYLVG